MSQDNQDSCLYNDTAKRLNTWRGRIEELDMPMPKLISESIIELERQQSVIEAYGRKIDELQKQIDEGLISTKNIARAIVPAKKEARDDAEVGKALRLLLDQGPTPQVVTLCKKDLRTYAVTAPAIQYASFIGTTLIDALHQPKVVQD